MTKKKRTTDLLPKTSLEDPVRYQIFTDGSCDHRDGVSGYAAIVSDAATGNMIYRGGVETGASVRRAELRGFLVGMQLVAELSGLSDPKYRRTQSGLPRPLVRWWSDRGDITGSVTIKEGQERLNSRDQDEDLWTHVSWYELWFRVEAVHVKRNTIGAQAEADRVSGILRRMMQATVAQMKDDSSTYLQ